MKENKFNPQLAYLKICSWDSLEILVVVKEDDLLEDRFLKTYDFVGDLEDKTNTDLINLVFSFMGASEHVDEKHIKSDGFILKHQISV